MGVLSHLEPKSVFYFFEAISNIPRGSKNEKAVSDFIVQFANDRKLYCRQDNAWNVVVKKAATAGYENVPAIILQGHMDMVCEKNADTIHDFLNDPLDLNIDGDFIKARGTTLGADDGIAVAMMLALLDAQNIAHPPIECLFTSDEEQGMGGVKAFDPFDLEGRRLINLDSEEEGHLWVSCSGGQRVVITLPVQREPEPKAGKTYKISVSGLKGGHSGSEIHMEKANANKLLGRILVRLSDCFAYRLVSIEGGLMENAIPREASAVVWLEEENMQAVIETVMQMETVFYNEYYEQDKAVKLAVSPLTEKVGQVMTKETSENVKNILLLIPYGVESMMTGPLKDVVESSSNIGVVRTEGDKVLFCSATRSSVATKKEAIWYKLRALSQLTGAECEAMDDYPAWTHNPDSKLLHLLKSVYQKTYARDAVVTAIHAGLECGILGEKMPGLDMISIGPHMADVHTPQECLSIASTKRTWEFLIEILKSMKEV